MKKAVCEAVFLVMLHCCFLHAQSPDPLSFFPHHLGDVWQRAVVPVSWQNIITKDSLGLDGRYYIDMSSDGKLQLDTTTLELYGWWPYGGVYNVLLLRLDAQEGDRWVVGRGPNSVTVATVAAEFNAFVIDTVVQLKQIDWADSASGLLLLTQYYASGFGLVGEDIDAFPDWRLLGARINGVQHGHVVSVSEQRTGVPNGPFVLHQNYPNPFNPSTTFKFGLPEPAIVSLVVYDLLGRQIAEVVSGRFEAGYHSLTWNARLPSSNSGGQASDVASGVYFARFTATSLEGGVRFATVGKLILMK